jgi:hypothetical protein
LHPSSIQPTKFTDSQGHNLKTPVPQFLPKNLTPWRDSNPGRPFLEAQMRFLFSPQKMKARNLVLRKATDCLVKGSHLNHAKAAHLVKHDCFFTYGLFSQW